MFNVVGCNIPRKPTDDVINSKIYNGLEQRHAFSVVTCNLV